MSDESLPTARGKRDAQAPDRAGRLRLGLALGEGGMAVVYEGFDTVMQRRAAVKCLHEELAQSAEARARFAEEVRILGSLDHPGALPIFEEGLLDDGRPYYSMRRVHGETLQDLLDRRTPKDLADRSNLVHFLHLFERVCETVAAAHAKGIIHRDLKPENVMVDEAGSVFVVDWGLAKRLERDGGDDPGLTRFGEVVGTPSFMAPEIADGRSSRSERHADVFSLGAILYEILTGVRAFRGKTGEEVMSQVLHSAPEDPRKINRRVSRSLAAVCRKAMNKDPYRRYPDAGQLAADLRRLREFRSVSAAKPSLGERLGNASRRYPRAATAVATATVVLLMTLAAVAFKAVTDAHLISEAHESIDRIEQRLADLDSRIRSLEEEIGGLPVGSLRRLELEEQRADLVALRRIEHDFLEWTVWAMLGFTYFAPDRFAEERARELVREEIELAIRDGDWTRASAAAQFTLDRLDESEILTWTAEDERWLRERLEHIEATRERRRVSPEPVGVEGAPAATPRTE